MAKSWELEQCDGVDQRERAARHLLIGKNVLNGLGDPGDVLQIQVRPLWDQRYRVNVVVGTHFASARVANSYFLEADVDGNVIGSTPKIERQYGRPAEKPNPLPPAASSLLG